MAQNELVKYEPELNTIPLRKFTSVEMNLFFSIISRMRDKEDTTMRFHFDQLKDLSDYKATSNKRFVKDLEVTYDKLMDLRFGRRSADGLDSERFVMFTDFDIKGTSEQPYVDVSIHPKALHLLNDLESWVRFSLHQFNELQSSYAKTMFRLLKQFRTKGIAYFSKDDFHQLLDIPTSYKQGEINRSVLKPIQDELKPIFKGLTIAKKYGKGRGTPVIGYTFSFKAERKDADDFNQHAPRTEIKKQIKEIEQGNLSDDQKQKLIDYLEKRLED
ncbi:replication initiation protein [Listeria booriae]|uniref:replication initiation protein n=1 Tax=Listeria booriae TaxID=1552123 RepID=UPI001623AE61|nr:replication initiation protein [Listeria booriae]MBC2058095.1 replication initiation protein [Listeria booriae]MBC2069416.1 replication initiation protein [Listeria booriae]